VATVEEMIERFGGVEVFVVAGLRRKLHKGVRQGGRLLSDERDNLDQTDPERREEYTDYRIAVRAAKILCFRCFAGGGVE
jgi:hypothetical protein